MKRAGHLFQQICSFSNLLLAAKKAQKGKRFNHNVLSFNIEIESELIRLQQELLQKTYRPGKYTEFYITDPKKRKISAAPYRDRVIHHALCNILEPILEKCSIFHSYACRVNKGNHKALLKASEYARKDRYVLKCDIKKFFSSIDHEILKAKIRRLIKDSDCLWLVDMIIDTSNPQERVVDYFPGDNLFTPTTRRKGIPIGNLTSQFFANLYLTGLDSYVKEKLKCKNYIRYMDDFLLFGDNSGKLRQMGIEVGKWLECDRLKLHLKKSVVYRTDKEFPFLGFLISDTHRRLRPEPKRRAMRRLKVMQEMFEVGTITPVEVHQRIMSWLGHVKWGSTYRFRKRFFKKAVFSKGMGQNGVFCVAVPGTIQ
jgi:retron-type reverse transcriptase